MFTSFSPAQVWLKINIWFWNSISVCLCLQSVKCMQLTVGEPCLYDYKTSVSVRLHVSACKWPSHRFDWHVTNIWRSEAQQAVSRPPLIGHTGYCWTKLTKHPFTADNKLKKPSHDLVDFMCCLWFISDSINKILYCLLKLRIKPCISRCVWLINTKQGHTYICLQTQNPTNTQKHG